LKQDDIVKARWVWGVYGDYDGNAPDTGRLSFDQLTEAEAEKLAEAATKAHQDDDEEFWEENEGVLSFPCVDGHQYCLQFKTLKFLVEVKD